MSTNAARTDDATGDTKVKVVDTKLEVIVIPVSDLDRAREFYTGQRDTNWPDWYAAYMSPSRPGRRCRHEPAAPSSRRRLSQGRVRQWR